MGIFISDDKRLDLLIKTLNKSLNLNLSNEQHNDLVFELYKHIDHTRKFAYHYGYEQGKFDEKIENISN
jgi:hypothetical protein